MAFPAEILRLSELIADKITGGIIDGVEIIGSTITATTEIIGATMTGGKIVGAILQTGADTEKRIEIKDTAFDGGNGGSIEYFSESANEVYPGQIRWDVRDIGTGLERAMLSLWTPYLGALASQVGLQIQGKSRDGSINPEAYFGMPLTAQQFFSNEYQFSKSGANPFTISALNMNTQIVAFDATGTGSINHGLGSTPDAVFCFLNDVPGQANLIQGDDASWTNTKFDLRLRVSNTGAIIPSVNRKISWLAVKF